MNNLKQSVLLPLLHAVLLPLLSALLCPGPARAAEPASFSLRSSTLEVEMSREFPAVLRYRLPDSGLEFAGDLDGRGQLLLDGTAYETQVSVEPQADRAVYLLQLPELQLTLSLAVELRDKSLQMTWLKPLEGGAQRIHSLAIADSPLLSCADADNAQFAGARMYTKVEGSGDTYIALDGSEESDAERQGYMYAMLSNGLLSASIWTNAVYDNPEGATARENGRIWKQTLADGDGMRTGIWSGDWLVQAEGSTELEPNPQLRVVITADANADDVVDWQDGAIAYRSIMRVPQGSERIPEQVVQRIVHNFGSQATNPFLKTIDETERIDLATAGLGQKILLKGYQSEGHDSAHPDYGGNYNTRAGGLRDLAELVAHCRYANADVGVHINAQEAYPEAYAFSDDLTLEQEGWSWLDQAWVIDKRQDALSGNRLKRLQRLASELPGLEFIYLDVWYQDGWESRRIAREINQQGWTLATEFPTACEYDATWDHWAVDYDYGGSDLKGFHSDIARFIGNHLKDCWVARHPLLGGTELTDYEGWQGHRDFDAALDTVFRVNLPSKWLQHFEIISWNEDEIAFTGNVVARLVDGRRVITQDGRIVLDGDSYLLPWPPRNPDRYYYRNPGAAPTSWELPPAPEAPASCFLQQLNDLDNAVPLELQPRDSHLDLPADSGYASLLTLNQPHFCCPRNYGQSGPIADPGFNSGGFVGKSVSASDSCVRVIRNESGDYELNVGSGNALQIGVPLKLSQPGTYAVSMDVELRGDDPRKLSMSVEGAANPAGAADSAWLDQPAAVNYVAADPRHGRAMQRMQLLFDLPAGFSDPQLLLDFEASYGGDIYIDDLQCVPAVRPPLPEGAYFFEDFEHTVRGWYPFVKGAAGGASDMRTHLSERHDPYTQRGWRDRKIDDVIAGQWSLKSHADNPGLLYRTIPQNLRFEPGYRYVVTLEYESSGDGTHEIVVASSSGEEYSIPLKQALAPTPLLFRFRAAEDGSSWFGIRKPAESETDLVIDNLMVTREALPQDAQEDDDE